MQHAWVAALLTAALFSGCVGDPPGADDDDGQSTAHFDDVVVIAVVDSGFNPYHWDFLADHMPQHTDDDPANDLPLDQDPAAWLPGFPGRDAFASHTRLELTLTPDDPDAVPGDLYDADSTWEKAQGSGAAAVHYNYIPGTKVVGYVNFGSGDGFSPASHGVGTSSVSTGNIHGSCPHCLLVFVNGPSEVANEWVAEQDWIDLQTNSYGFSTAMRDRMYAGSDTDLQRASIERGQQIFFSAGNGQANTFTVPNPTLFSSQEGPDWIVTVGAISPTDGSSYSGHGKPADIASVGSGYPSAGGGTVTANSTFGGTSNATPVTAGMYGEALHRLRTLMANADRVQQGGVVATATGFVDSMDVTYTDSDESGDDGAVQAEESGAEWPSLCASANRECALADGKLTIDELRTALFRAAEHTPAGWSTQGQEYPEETREQTYMAEGHGSFWGKLESEEVWDAEVERIVGYANGTWFEEQPAEERDWFIADSYCRQSVWGAWDEGYHVAGETEVPARDPDWPTRSWLVDQCPAVVGTVVEAERAKDGGQATALPLQD